MAEIPLNNTDDLRSTLGHLAAGDFSTIEPLFDDGRLPAWIRAGRLDDHPRELAEALTAACMLGKTAAAEELLDRGVDLLAGDNTWLNGFHYAISSGHLDTVRMLIRRGLPLEVRNNYGGTMLGQATHSALHEPRPDHVAIIDALLEAGANVADYEALAGEIAEARRRHATMWR